MLEYGQKVMGRGGSIVNVKIKSLTEGKILDRTFKGNEQIRSADVSNGNAQYLYNDGSTYFFMDETSLSSTRLRLILLDINHVSLKRATGSKHKASTGKLLVLNYQKMYF